jgi:hypothetical protein
MCNVAYEAFGYGLTLGKNCKNMTEPLDAKSIYDFNRQRKYLQSGSLLEYSAAVDAKWLGVFEIRGWLV